MRAHVFLSRRHEPRLETIINGFGDRLHGSVAARDCRDNLTLTVTSMLEVRSHQGRRIVDRRAVRGHQRLGIEIEDALERFQILDQVATVARIDRYAAAGDEEIARVKSPRRVMPERKVVG